MTVLFRSLLGSASLLAGCALALTPAAALAQTAAPSSSQAEAQSAADAGRTLANAMSRLASSPRDTAALIDAGEAALKLDDPRSAIGFFGRADDVSPNNGRVKAGLGRAMLALGQTGDGLRLMEQAATLRYSDLPLLIDRGLARDLSGNQAGAQRDYQEALQRDPDNAVALRRYAVSLGISGQVDMAERTLQPLLYKNDRAAWRDRAFILAMNGRTADALDITSKTMPPALADAIKPYIERMAMLTPGQRAAAVHMGQFPAGLVNVRVASTAVPAPQPPSATVEPAERKSGRERPPRTRTTRAAARESAAATRIAAAPVAPSAPTPAPATPPPASAGRATPAPATSAPATPAPAARPVAGPAASATPASQSPASQPAASPAPQPAPVVRAAAPTPPTSTSPASPPATPRVDLRPATAVAATPREPVGTAVAAQPPAARQIQGPPTPVEGAVRTPAAPAASPATPAAAPATPAPAVASVPAATPASTPTPTPAAPAESTRSLAEIMAEISIPEAERRQDVVPVNLAEIAAMQAEKRRQEAAEARARKAAEAKEAARRKAEAEAKAKAEAEKKRLADNPARYWVQIGVGRDKGALAFTLRRMKKDHAALARYDGWSAGWGQTNRLVVGPFPNLAKARAVEAEMKKAGSDAFVWRSDAGEEVDRIGG